MSILLSVSVHITFIIDATDPQSSPVQEALESMEEHTGRHHKHLTDTLQDAPLD